MIVFLMLLALAGLIWHVLLLHIDRWSLLDRLRRARNTQMARLVTSYEEDLDHNKVALIKRYVSALILGAIIILMLEC